MKCNIFILTTFLRLCQPLSYNNSPHLSKLLEKKLIAQAEKYKAEASKLRIEASILEKELLEKRIINDDYDKKQLTSNNIMKEILIVKAQNIRLDWSLHINGNADVEICVNNNKLANISGKWYTKYSRYGIGGNIFLFAKNKNMTVKCVFLKVKKADALSLINTYSYYQKIANNVPTKIDSLTNLINIEKPNNLFPIINQESILSLSLKSLRKWINNIIKRFATKIFNYIYTKYRTNIKKWKTITQLLRLNNTIILNENPYVISEYGYIKTKSNGILDNINSECTLILRNTKKSRTGGRATRVVS